MPSHEDLIAVLVQELSPQYDATYDDGRWVLMHRKSGRTIGLDISLDELASYVGRLEAPSFETLGIEPRWRSALAMISVYISERAAMLPSDEQWVVYAGDGFIGAHNPRC